MDCEKYQNRELLKFYSEIIDVLRERKIIRSSNAPLGDYCEWLFCNALGWKIEPGSKKGYDAVDSNKIRIQIKGRRPTKQNKRRQLSAIRNLEEKNFDLLAACIFNEDYTVLKAAIIPHAVVARNSKYSNHTRSWTFILDDKIWEQDGVIDVSNELKKYTEENTQIS